ncbi:E3 ubiquitin-protein ligase sina-like [Rhipicephalus microplus]|uniref:E3 ubiquitin-protein ligase sina-like n=1 Tax=Rhipicephalus microplus TaxID=6941 RepID=UPI003F6B4FB8
MKIPASAGENVVVTATNFRRVEPFCWVALQTCLGRDFVVMLRKRNNRASRNHFFGAVLLIGSSEEAWRFLYRFEMRGAEHRLSWSARTRNLHSQADIDRSGDGLVVDMSTAPLQWRRPHHGRHRQRRSVLER